MDEAPVRSDSCCARLWGPTTPLFGGHTVEEAGTSRFTHAWPVFVLRLLYALTTISLVFAFPAERYLYFFDKHSVLALGNWNWFFLGVSFALLAVCSIQAARKQSTGWIPNVAVPLYQTAATGILFGFLIDIIATWGSVWYLHEYSVYTYLYAYGIFGFPLIPVIFDVLLGARVRFRLAYLPFPVIIFGIWHAAYWIFYGRDRVKHISSSAGVFVAVNIGLAVWGLGAGVIMMLFTRMYDCCSSSADSFASDEENQTAVT